jgi:hypothetical protein
MAIDWKVKFTEKQNGHYSAVFNRFDTVAPDVMLQTVNILDAILDTDAQKNALWDQVKAEQVKQAAINSTVADLETTGKTALMAKEI